MMTGRVWSRGPETSTGGFPRWRVKSEIRNKFKMGISNDRNSVAWKRSSIHGGAAESRFALRLGEFPDGQFGAEGRCL